MIELDFSELKGFSDGLLNIDMAGLARRLSLELLIKLEKNTPVRSGLLRRSWKAGEVVKKNNVYDVLIDNEVSYAEYVELGHRLVRHGVTIKWVNGRFMLRLSERQLERQIPELVESFIKRGFRND